MAIKSQIKLGAILSYLSIIVNILAGLVYTPWMIEQIGKSQYGLFTLANSLITLFLVDFGLSAATARFVSKYNSEGNQKKVNDFLGAVYKLYLFISAIIFIVFITVYLFLDKIYVKLTPEELSQFKVVYVIAGLYAIVSFPFITLNGIMTAYEKFIQLKAADLIYRFLNIGLMIFALWRGYGLYALVTVNAVSGIIIIIYKYIVIKSTTPVKVCFKRNSKDVYKSIFSFSLWTTVNSLAQRLIFNITPSILGIVSGSADIAVFGIVTTIEGYTFTFTTAINGMFMPEISRIYTKNGDDADIMPLMLKVGKFQFALNCLIVGGFSVLGKSFIDLWMGRDYMSAYIGILMVIIPGMFFNSLQIANTAMIVRNKVKLQAYIAVATGIMNVICSFILSSLFNVIGACISIFIAYSFRAILYHVICKKVMRINIKLFIKECYLKMIIPFIIMIFSGIILNILISSGGWIVLGIKGVCISIMYFLCLWLLSFSKEERKNILSRIKCKLHIVSE